MQHRWYGKFVAAAAVSLLVAVAASLFLIHGLVVTGQGVNPLTPQVLPSLTPDIPTLVPNVAQQGPVLRGDVGTQMADSHTAGKGQGIEELTRNTGATAIVATLAASATIEQSTKEAATKEAEIARKAEIDKATKEVADLKGTNEALKATLDAKTTVLSTTIGTITPGPPTNPTSDKWLDDLVTQLAKWIRSDFGTVITSALGFIGASSLALLGIQSVRYVRDIKSGHDDAKRMLAQAKARSAPVSPQTPTSDPTQFNPQGSYWKDLETQAEIVAVVSSKGGVGKSSISLGLLEYYSQRGQVLLVDFDLHNRGLTSKLLPKLLEKRQHGEPPYSTLLEQLQRFESGILQDIRSQFRPIKAGRQAESSAKGDSDSQFDIADISQEDFVKYRDAFAAGPRPGDVANISYVKMNHENKPYGNVDPGKCFFLPSRKSIFVDDYDRFIATNVSRMDIPEVALFIKFLAHWVVIKGKRERDASPRGEKSIDYIILDCHGAQDLFMVGAIVAADHIVVVTTPDSGAFEGTYELLDFTKRLEDEQQKVFGKERLTQALVINEYRRSDMDVIKALTTLAEDRGIQALKDSVKIGYSERLYRTYKDYQVPTICKQATLWPKVVALAGDSRRPNLRTSPTSTGLSMPSSTSDLSSKGNPSSDNSENDQR
jgi:cellulose biosynthesis protein BcsQ